MHIWLWWINEDANKLGAIIQVEFASPLCCDRNDRVDLVKPASLYREQNHGLMDAKNKMIGEDECGDAEQTNANAPTRLPNPVDAHASTRLPSAGVSRPL